MKANSIKSILKQALIRASKEKFITPILEDLDQEIYFMVREKLEGLKVEIVEICDICDVAKPHCWDNCVQFNKLCDDKDKNKILDQAIKLFE